MNSERTASDLSPFSQGVCGWPWEERHGAELRGVVLHLWKCLLWWGLQEMKAGVVYSRSSHEGWGCMQPQLT